ncbi:chromosome segregation protein SMC [Candidatus Bipolaricaulota bacterium]|nr:chromosome segregation protein SMC [Candidatus Bipolaricaulota bacterium]
MSILNNLILRGFKSFNKKTTIPFQKRGMTAIIGENGSGKSNIIDGLTFVMGQRSSKLRANKLSQLIYNGGENGTPADRARVTITLDNTDDRFSEIVSEVLEDGKNPDEITIGRKVTHNSSAYKFMGKNCKRSVIDDILDEANMDPSRHHIVNQGKVTEIINMSSTNRREIIDRLAGISEYDERKQQAIRDLRDVKEKLMTNRVILGERRSQLNRLEKERNAALDYREKEEELKLVEKSIDHKKVKNKREELEKFQKKEKRIKEKLSGLEERLEAADKNAEKKEKELKELKEERQGDQEEKLSKEVEQVKMDLVQKRGDIRSQEKELDNLKETVKELKKLKNQSKSKSTRKKRSVKALLDRGRGGIYGTVQGLMEVEAKYQVAVETTIGGHLQDLVVDTRSTAIESVNYLKENDLGRARFLPLRSVSGSRMSQASKKALKMSGVIDYAIELVDFDSKYQRAFQYVCRDTLIAEDLEAVEEAENVRVVTLDGDVLSKGGAVSGGTSKKKRSKSTNKRKEELKEKIETKKKRVNRLENKIEEGKKELASLKKKLDKKEKQLDERTEMDKELKEKAEKLESELGELKKRQKDLYRKTESQKRKKDNVEKDIQGVKRDLKNLNEPEEDLDFLDQPLKKLITEKRNLKRDLDRLQPVNMKAIDEYEDFKNQVEDLEDKLKRLRKEKREVERLIGKIEEEKKEKFYSTMEELSECFGEIFQKLFDGGSAHLELGREGDIESGLLIKAHPPGKELIVLDSLSGGEKTLTAIAFIFALQEMNPAPVYVMDEIDAALDQRRSTKVADLLEEYSSDAQLILISHNEETAKHADQVFGVSMNNGQSEVLSIKLN